MRHPPLLPALALLLGLVATVVAQTPPQQPTPPAPPQARRPVKVGVVDIGTLFREYRRKDELEQQVNAEREQVKGNLDGRAEQVRKMREALDKSPFREGSEGWLRQRDEIKMAQFSLELEGERLQSGLKKRVEELTLQILTEIEKTIDSFGARFGYDLILKSDQGDPPAMAQQSELTAQFQERIFRAQISDVLFHGDSIDITEAVKRELNSDANLQKMRADAAAAAQQHPAPPTPPTPPGPGGTAPTPPADQGKKQ